MLDPILQVIAIQEKCVDLINVVVRRSVMLAAFIYHLKAGVPSPHSVILFTITRHPGSSLPENSTDPRWRGHAFHAEVQHIIPGWPHRCPEVRPVDVFARVPSAPAALPRGERGVGVPG